MAGKEKEMSVSARRSRLGIGTAKWAEANLGSIDVVCPDRLGTSKIGSGNLWQLQRRSKELLVMRAVTPELVARLDYRQEWNQWRAVDSVLDLFPALKYSYSSLRGRRMVGVVNVLSNGNKTRVGDIARSHSIRLDPVEAPKELFKYRQRIQKIIEWAHCHDLVPVMMTLTLYHRWQPLAPLCRVLRQAWSSLFGNGRAGFERKKYVGLRGYIRRMEETFNDGDACATNAGWHPHYHIILIVPRENLFILSKYEKELKRVWVELVNKYYVAEFGEGIPAAYYERFKEHGLVFSRYKSEEHAARCGNPNGKAGGLLEVHDGKYLAKIMGTDEPIYGGDTELTAVMQKTSKSPFDMLRGEVTANLADLWCEYALATKKVPCFTFSHGLQKEVDEYFAMKSPRPDDAIPEEKLVASVTAEDYHWLYRHFQVGNLLEKAKEGGTAVATWLKETFNIDAVANEEELAESASLSVADAVEVGACPEVLDCSNVGAYDSPFIKRAKQRLIFTVQNKSPPNKAPPYYCQNFKKGV